MQTIALGAELMDGLEAFESKDCLKAKPSGSASMFLLRDVRKRVARMPGADVLRFPKPIAKALKYTGGVGPVGPGAGPLPQAAAQDRPEEVTAARASWICVDTSSSRGLPISLTVVGAAVLVGTPSAVLRTCCDAGQRVRKGFTDAAAWLNDEAAWLRIRLQD
eukprot:g9946.t1